MIAGQIVAFVNPKYIVQLCLACGTARQKTLGEFWYSSKLGYELDRDTNTAKIFSKSILE